MKEILGAAARVFEALAVTRNRLYDRRWLPVESAPRPVISVGNVTVGGAGKTPLVLELAGRLLAAGTPVAILTRGYRRASRRPILLPPGTPLPAFLGPRELGDEPWLLRQRLPGVGLGIDCSRRRAARVLAPHLPGGAFLLDDGFQHRGLYRDLDVVVVAAEERLATEALLPLGRLREPPSALARAHQIIVIAAPREGSTGGEDSDAEMQSALAEVARFAPHRPVAQARLVLRGLRPLGQAGSPLVPPATVPGPVAALAGIARPERLAAGLAAAGMTVARRHHFPDHHRFTPGNLAAIQEAFRGMAAVVTTEKDEPRLLLARAEPSSAPFLDGVLILVAVMDLVFIAGEREFMRAVGAVAMSGNLA